LWTEIIIAFPGRAKFRKSSEKVQIQFGPQ
jgi:hypothetical protein